MLDGVACAIILASGLVQYNRCKRKFVMNEREDTMKLELAVINGLVFMKAVFEKPMLESATVKLLWLEEPGCLRKA